MSPKEIVLDKDLNISRYSPVCTYCANNRGFRVCRAFDVIPMDIWSGENDHSESFLGDNGIRFKEVKQS